MAAFMGTKADTLQYLSERVVCSRIEKMYIVDVAKYMQDQSGVADTDM